jgi:hypothetical protein
MIGCSAHQIVTNLPHSFEYDHNDIITVLVGENEEKFTAHKDSICERSKCFGAACATDRWLEGREKVVPLPYLQPAAFKTYLHWMLTGELLSEIYWGHENITRPKTRGLTLRRTSSETFWTMPTTVDTRCKRSSPRSLRGTNAPTLS